MTQKIPSGSPAADAKQRKIVITPGQLRALTKHPEYVDHVLEAIDSMPGVSIANAIQFAEYRIQRDAQTSIPTK